MTVADSQVETMDPGLFALTVLLRLGGVQVEAESVRKRCGAGRVGISEMLNCAKAMGLDAKLRILNWKDLAGAKLPAIASLRGEQFVIVAEIREDTIVVADQASKGRREIGRAEFEALWDGHLVQIVRPKRTIEGAPNLSKIRAGDGVASAKKEERDKAAELNANASERESQAETKTADESALVALVMLLRIHGVSAEAGQIRHRIGTPKIGATEMLRYAKQVGLKASIRSSNWERLAKTPLPGIAALRDGGFLIIGNAPRTRYSSSDPSRLVPK